MGEYQGRQVAVKVLKVYLTSDFDKIANVGRSRRRARSRWEADPYHVEVLQGSYDVEDPSPSKCVTTAGSDNG